MPSRELMRSVVSKMEHAMRYLRKTERELHGVNVSKMVKVHVGVDVFFGASAEGFGEFGRLRSSLANTDDTAYSSALVAADIGTIVGDAVADSVAKEANGMNDSHDRAENDVAAVSEAHRLSLADVVHYGAELLAVPEIAWGDGCSSLFGKTRGPLLPDGQHCRSGQN